MGLAKTVPFSLFLILLNFQAKGQKNLSHQSLYWLRYYNQLNINKKWAWHNEIEDRRFFKGNTQHHLIIHSRLHYNIFNNAEIGFGLTYSLQSPQDPNSTTGMVVPELRPVQEITLSNPLSNKLTLQQRLRIDHRFIHRNDGTVLLDGYNYNLRFRYRLQANIQLNKDDATNTTTLKLADELMINAGSRIIYNQFDQNRIYAGLEQGLRKNISVELGYLHWYQQNSSGFQFFERDIIRLTLNHKIKP